MNLTMKALRTVVAKLVRAGLGFTIVNPNGLLGFTTIQDAVDFVATKGGGKIHVAPGTYYENIDITSDNIHIIGSGMKVTIVDGASVDHAAFLLQDAEWCSLSDMTIQTDEGGGTTNGYGVRQNNGNFCQYHRLDFPECDQTALIMIGTNSYNIVANCVIPKDDHDGYSAIDISCSTGEFNLTIGCIAVGSAGNLYGFSHSGDTSAIVGCIFDGNTSTYGMLLATAAANSLISGCICSNVLSTDLWDQAGTGHVDITYTNEVS